MGGNHMLDNYDVPGVVFVGFGKFDRCFITKRTEMIGK